jgi:hypothetical protein
VQYTASRTEGCRFLRNAVALVFWLIIGSTVLPSRAKDETPLSQRLISPVQVAALKQALAGLPKGKIKLMLWAGADTMLVDPGPGPGPHHLTDDQIGWGFNDPDPAKPLNDNSEIIILGKQLARILKACGYEVKMDAAIGSPTLNVSINTLSRPALPVTTAIQNALAASHIKVLSGGDGTKRTIPLTREIICIWIGRQAPRF